MSSSNRISKDAILVEYKEFVLEPMHARKGKNENSNELTQEQVDGKTEKEKEWQSKEEALRLREEEIERKENQLMEKQQQLDTLHVELQRAIVEQTEQLQVIEKEKVEQQKQFQEEKILFFMNMQDEMWTLIIDNMELLLNQKIAQKDFSPLAVFEGMLKKMNISFSELEVTASPETVQAIQQNEKSEWMSKSIHWKYDYNLQFGEFVVEEEKEYFSLLFKEVLADYREQIRNQNEYERESGQNDD